MTKRISAIRTLCLGAVLLFTAGNSHADDGYLVFNTFAWHFDNSDERNDFTPGVGWEYSPTSAVGFHLGTLSDSFGYQAKYLGVNYATRRMLNNRVRLILGATIIEKQFKLAKDGDDGVDTRVLPLPAVEFTLTPRAVLNFSGSPAVDFGDQKNNAVVWVQLKVGLS
jgi:hypothetical protein